MSPIHDLRTYLDVLDAHGRLARIDTGVSLTHETADVAATLARTRGRRAGLPNIRIRRRLLEMESRRLSALRPNLFYGTGLAASILILRQRKHPSSADQSNLALWNPGIYRLAP